VARVKSGGIGLPGWSGFGERVELVEFGKNSRDGRIDIKRDVKATIGKSSNVEPAQDRFAESVWLVRCKTNNLETLAVGHFLPFRASRFRQNILQLWT
jgi:hypothetical protein